MEEDTKTDAENLAELTEHVAVLGDTIEELDLGGPTDGHVCTIASARLREFAEGRQKLGHIAASFVEAGLVDPNVGDEFDMLDTIVTKYRRLEGERDTLQAKVEQLDASAEAARLADEKKAKAVPQKRTQSARKIGPIKLKNNDKAATASELLEKIKAGEKVEIAFSDGKSEVAALGSRVIYGDAWEVLGSKLRLRLDKLEVFGPNRDEPDIKIHGYGLIVDDELIAYGPRIDVLVLKPGSISDLKDDIVFFT